MLASGMRVLTVGNRYPADGGGAEAAAWPALVAALRARGDDVHVLTSDESGPELAGVDRSLHWFGAAGGGWRRPARLEASRISRHGLLCLGATLQRLRPDAVLWASMGGLPLTLVGASGLPELALVLDEWPVYGPQVDLKARQDGWEPGGVDAWSCASAALRADVLASLGDAVDPRRFAVDPEPATGAWVARVLGRLDALVSAG
jgi:hypothetical protein